MLPHRLAALALAAALLASPAAALEPAPATEPSYHRVAGVASDDVLNIRAAPEAGAPVLGGFAPGAGPVEVVETRQGWGRVTAGERGGWVSMRYLEPVDLPEIGASGLPAGLVCAGTEPFWSLSLKPGGRAVLSRLGETRKRLFALAEAARASGRRDLSALWLAAPGDGALAAVAHVSARACSDGMSDRVMAYRIALSLADGPGRETLAGCCRLPPPAP